MFSGTKETINVRSNELGTTLFINEVEVGRDSAVTVVSKKQDLRLRASKKVVVTHRQLGKDHLMQ
ncbi:MAG: hypothetical protein IPL26_29105 [Leptospiraceae bacterium]|nr:hypothetical protein [Leptospiraceae bacterium]